MKQIIYLSFIFGASELLLGIIKRAKSGNSKIQGDNGSLIIMWLAITFGFTAGFFLARQVNQFWLGFGIALIANGFIIRWISILQLGKSFTVNVAITNAAKLKTDGLYERVRHPSYSGLLSIIAGFAFTMNSFYSFISFVVPVFLAIQYRINIEEKVLSNEFGSAYLEYKNKTKKLFPGVY